MVLHQGVNSLIAREENMAERSCLYNNRGNKNQFLMKWPFTLPNLQLFEHLQKTWRGSMSELPLLALDGGKSSPWGSLCL